MAAVSGAVDSPLETGHDSRALVIILSVLCRRVLPTHSSGLLCGGAVSVGVVSSPVIPDGARDGWMS